MQAGARRYPEPPFPEQHQAKPGVEAALDPAADVRRPFYKGSDKLKGKVALITGGDSGIGRSVAVLFAREGADVAIAYLDEDTRTPRTPARPWRRRAARCILICRRRRRRAPSAETAVDRTVKELGQLDVLVNNAAFQEHMRRVRGPDRRAFRPDAEDQPLRLFPHGQGGRAAHGAGLGHRQ